MKDNDPASVRIDAMMRADFPTQVLLSASPANSPTVSDCFPDTAKANSSASTSIALMQDPQQVGSGPEIVSPARP